MNILPNLLNAYIQTDVPIQPFRAWLSEDQPLELVPLPVDIE